MGDPSKYNRGGHASPSGYGPLSMAYQHAQTPICQGRRGVGVVKFRMNKSVSGKNMVERWLMRLCELCNGNKPLLY